MYIIHYPHLFHPLPLPKNKQTKTNKQKCLLTLLYSGCVTKPDTSSSCSLSLGVVKLNSKRPAKNIARNAVDVYLSRCREGFRN